MDPVVTATDAGSQPGTGTVTADPAAPPAASGSAAAPPAAPDSPNIRQLREQYEQTKQQFEPWQKLGIKPEEAARAHQTYSKMHTEASTLADKLGVDPEAFKANWENDPAFTVNELRRLARQQQSAPPKPPTEKDIEKLVQKQLQPLLAKEQARLVEAANDRFSGELDRQFKAGFPDGIDDDNRAIIREFVENAMAGDAEAIARLRDEGKVADVQRLFQQAKTRWEKAFNAYSGSNRGRSGEKPGNRPPAEDPNDWRNGEMVVGGKKMKVSDLSIFKNSALH